MRVRQFSKCAALLAVALSLPIAATPAAAFSKDPPPHLYGPPPSWSEFRQIAESDLKARLIDPDSAKIQWTGGYAKGAIKPFLSSWISGYYACGLINARNRMGGYTGATRFLSLIDYGRVLYAQIDNTPRGQANASCGSAEANGLFPPVPTDTSTAGDDNATGSPASMPVSGSATGLSLTAMPDGAYVGAVADGSPASHAGLKPGMVITKVNGIPLAGMGAAMLKVVSAAGASATLTLVDGKTVALGGRPMKLIYMALMLAVAAPASGRPPDSYGPLPDWSRYKDLGTAAVLAKLPDPGDWQVDWPNGYWQGGWKHKGRFPGYLTCGVLRAIKPIKDRYPVVNFVAVIDHDQVQTIDISDHWSNSLVNVMCASLVRRGVLPPASLMAVAPARTIDRLGATIRTVPEGVYVSAVTDGSAGAKAGLKAGMVLTTANGIGLGGLGDAADKVLASATAPLTLRTATGETLTVGGGS